MQVELASSPIGAVQLLPGRDQLLAISGHDAAVLDLRQGLAKVAEASADQPLTCCQADDATAALGTQSGQVRPANLSRGFCDCICCSVTLVA